MLHSCHLFQALKQWCLRACRDFVHFLQGDYMQKISETEWVLRKSRELLRTCGPKTARRFLDSRGGSSRHESASREIARHVMAEQKAKAF